MRDNLCSFNGKCNSISPCGEFKLFVVVEVRHRLFMLRRFLYFFLLFDDGTTKEYEKEKVFMWQIGK